MHALWALVGDPEAGAYELLFSFSTPGDKDQFLDLVRSNEEMGNDYIENDFMSPMTEEIRNARPLVAVLPETEPALRRVLMMRLLFTRLFPQSKSPQKPANVCELFDRLVDFMRAISGRIHASQH